MGFDVNAFNCCGGLAKGCGSGEVEPHASSLFLTVCEPEIGND